MRTKQTTGLVTLVFAVGMLFSQAVAQTPAPVASPSPRIKRTTTVVSRVIVENKLAAPQVVTILHSLNGLKLVRLLVRKENVDTITGLDDTFRIAGEVHVNVIAGLALDDGRTIAAWLPEAEAEMPPPTILFAPRTPVPPQPASGPSVGKGHNSSGLEPAPSLPPLPVIPPVNFSASLLDPADLRIITRDGKRLSGRYIGIDGLTGLSLITLTNGTAPQAVDSNEENVKVGQQLRVIGPQPAPHAEANVRAAMYVRIGETEATVVNVSRSPSGALARVKIKSAKLSPENIGGIAINDQGETLGIVDAVEGNEATIVPVALVRLAAKRVIERQAGVPRPWLGVRGEPVGTLSLDRILRVGWELERARALTEKRQGIMLTAIVPGSPAALAQLKPGDVILSVNNEFVRNGNDLSLLLDEAGPGSPVRFTIARPGQELSEALEIKLSESPDPLFGLRMRIPMPGVKSWSRSAEGIETVGLKPKVASRFGSSGGLLVVSVHPSTDAFKAGLRPGDVIESIDGHPVDSEALLAMPKAAGVPSTCVVIRNKEKLVMSFTYSTGHDAQKP